MPSLEPSSNNYIIILLPDRPKERCHALPQPVQQHLPYIEARLPSFHTKSRELNIHLLRHKFEASLKPARRKPCGINTTSWKEYLVHRLNPISSNFPLFCLEFPPLSCCFGVFGVLGVGGWVITPSTLTINQSGIGVVLVFGVLGVGG